MADYERVTEMNAAGAKRRGHAALDGQLVHRVHHRGAARARDRSPPRFASSSSATSTAIASPGRTLNSSRRNMSRSKIDLTICVDPDYFRADVEAALKQVLGCGILRDGTKGVFYPDNFTFGQTVYLSPIYAAARKVAGVQSVVSHRLPAARRAANLDLSGRRRDSARAFSDCASGQRSQLSRSWPVDA